MSEAFDSLPAAQALIQELRSQVLLLEFSLKAKEEEIRLLRWQRWGPKADQLVDGQIQLLDTEPSVTQAEVEQEASQPADRKDPGLPKKDKKPRTNHPGREALPKHLERRETTIPCKPEECKCAQCGKERPLIRHDTREELACDPAVFYTRVIKREVRGGCPCQEGTDGVVSAPAPAQIVPKSKLSNELVVEIVVDKWSKHLPIYRQCASLWQDHQIELSRGTLTDAVMTVGELLGPIVRAQAAELLAGNYLQADETTVPCQNRQTPKKNHQAYMVEFSYPGGPVVFRFHMSRAREQIEEFLRGFRGKLQCDGYRAYDKLGDGITFVACMAHIRREFVKTSALAPNDPLPREVVTRIAELYGIEKEAREKGLSASERLVLRQARAKPVMESLKKRIVEIRQQATPGLKLAKACDYALGQWPRMEEYLKDGEIELDNNWCEGAMRPVALGRKNWLHVGSESAGVKVAAIMSIVETCRRLDINLRRYLLDVLPGLAERPVSQMRQLTPAAWKASHP